MRPWQQLIHCGLFSAHSSSWLVLLYKAEAAMRATLMHVIQTEALQQRLCSSASIMVNP